MYLIVLSSESIFPIQLITKLLRIDCYTCYINVNMLLFIFTNVASGY